MVVLMAIGMGDIRLTRRHAILNARLGQVRRNLLAWRGGAPYIEVALTRYRCESDASWYGVPGRGILGRRERTSYINYAGRIVNKINQYVFAQGVERNGIASEFRDDATACGLSIDQLMEDVCAHLTVCGWCWLQADRPGPAIDPVTGRPRARTLAERERAGDRVFWQLWRPDEVVDWSFGVDGRLSWLITEQSVYDNTDLDVEPVTRQLRTIWKRGEGVRLWYNGDKVELEEPFTFSGGSVPFVCVGTPSAFPWWFDDVERLQAGLLNLESSHMESLSEAVFPQLVVPADLPDRMMSMLQVAGRDGAKQVFELVRGLNNPILESADAKGTTRYVMPDRGHLAAIPEEILRRRRELFEVVGLAMGNKDTAQVASAESKAWDHLDPTAVMRARAAKLEEVERKMVALSRAIDPSFSGWEPQYPRNFSIVDFASDIKALVELDQTVVSEGLRRELERVKAVVIAQRFGVPAARREAILSEIDTMPMTIGTGSMVEPLAMVE